MLSNQESIGVYSYLSFNIIAADAFEVIMVGDKSLSLPGCVWYLGIRGCYDREGRNLEIVVDGL
jgi:hypothetical protein